jgi:hypothetical protein
MKRELEKARHLLVSMKMSGEGFFRHSLHFPDGSLLEHVMFGTFSSGTSSALFMVVQKQRYHRAVL